MIDVYYTLPGDDGEIRYEKAPRSEHVPRAGELVTFAAVAEPATQRLPRDHGHLAVLEASGRGENQTGIRR